MGEDLLRHFKLLLHDCGDTGWRRFIDDRALFGSENALCFGALQQRIQIWHWLHHLNAIRLVLKTLINLQKRHDAAIAQSVWHWLAVRIAVHCALKQDGTQDLFAGKAWRCDDARTHVMDKSEHFFFGRISIFFDAITTKRLGR